MTRALNPVVGHARHKKILKQAAGYRGRRKSSYRVAVQAVTRALQYAYRDRRCRKRDFRALWIQRINAAARLYGLSYSRFMCGLRRAHIELDRRQLAELAVSDRESFAVLAERARQTLAD